MTGGAGRGSSRNLAIDELAAVLQQALDDLPDELRAALMLGKLEGLTRRYCRCTGVPVGT